MRREGGNKRGRNELAGRKVIATEGHASCGRGSGRKTGLRGRDGPRVGVEVDAGKESERGGW